MAFASAFTRRFNAFASETDLALIQLLGMQFSAFVRAVDEATASEIT